MPDQSSACVLAAAAGQRLALPLSDRAFHFELDQPFELDAVFHGELAHEIVDEPIYAKLIACASLRPRCCM